MTVVSFLETLGFKEPSDYDVSTAPGKKFYRHNRLSLHPRCNQPYSVLGNNPYRPVRMWLLKLPCLSALILAIRNRQPPRNRVPGEYYFFVQPLHFSLYPPPALNRKSRKRRVNSRRRAERRQRIDGGGKSFIASFLV